ncbi:MAG: histidine kinase [Ekhidna sp.]
MSKYLRNHLIGTVLIFLLGGVVNVVLFCSICLEEPYFLTRMFYINFCYNGMAWVAFWKGSEFLVEFWDKHIPWIETPIKRFVASLLSITIYIYLAVWALDLFFDLIVFELPLSKALEESGAPFKNVLLITLGINVFMHGRGFLISWRQASIDMEKLKTEQIASQYNSLKNQVNPHFLFNSMNALSSLVYDNQEKAVEFIRKLSQVYRYVLDSKDDEVVSFEREMGFVENFIFLQKIRFGENLKVEISEHKPSLFVPPLAIQMLVENAIKHNVVSEKDPLTIVIDVQNDCCIVKNNLKEKKVKDSTGIGLENIKSRYQYLSDREVEILKTDDSFEVRVPLLNMK